MLIKRLICKIKDHLFHLSVTIQENGDCDTTISCLRCDSAWKSLMVSEPVHSAAGKMNRFHHLKIEK